MITFLAVVLVPHPVLVYRSTWNSHFFFFSQLVRSLCSCFMELLTLFVYDWQLPVNFSVSFSHRCVWNSVFQLWSFSIFEFLDQILIDEVLHFFVFVFCNLLYLEIYFSYLLHVFIFVVTNLVVILQKLACHLLPLLKRVAVV